MVKYGFCTLLDIRIDTTMDCSSFHSRSMLRLQHAVNIFSNVRATDAYSCACEGVKGLLEDVQARSIHYGKIPWLW